MIEVSSKLNASGADPGTILPLDSIDWEIVAIEAKQGGVSADVARAVIDQTEELLTQSDLTLDDVMPVIRALLAILERHIPPPLKG